MRIGIHALAAFKRERTGVEEYAYQLVRHLAMLEEARKHQFFLYCPKSPRGDARYETFFNVSHIGIRELPWPFMWTQMRLRRELSKNPPDIFFSPAHVLPLSHPKNSVVTIQGLEYEYFPEHYPSWHRRYLAWATRFSLKRARKIIVPSTSTKLDLVGLYGGDPEKIVVIPHGIDKTKNLKPEAPAKALPACQSGRASAGRQNLKPNIKKPYIIYIGRIEGKKNVEGLVEAFTIFKEKYELPYTLVLVGPAGFGYAAICAAIARSPVAKDIVLTGWVSGEEKMSLLGGADLFALVSFYEGFGLPILEAQALGVPVVTSNISSMPEVAGRGAIFVHPEDPEDIVKGIYKIIGDQSLREKLVTHGRGNVAQYDWFGTARKTLEVLMYPTS